MIFFINSLLGINNVDDDKRAMKILESGGGTLTLSGDLLTCQNFRLTKDGKSVTRNGYTEKLAGTDAHSYWNTIKGDVAFFVDGSILYLLNSDYTATSKQTGLTESKDMRYIEHKTVRNSVAGDKEIFMGNGHEMYRYYDGTVSTWGDTSVIHEDLEYVPLAYSAPPPSNIFISHHARIWVADGHFLIPSESAGPERFRRTASFPAPERITALSRDAGHIYMHTNNTTTVLNGRDGPEMSQYELPIGAIQQVPLSPEKYPIGRNIFMTKQGWGYAINGEVGYIDQANFQLDLPDTAKCYNGYDWVNKEVVCSIVQ
jgi:hypothetical protein